jgi:hypothetical protein
MPSLRAYFHYGQKHEHDRLRDDGGAGRNRRSVWDKAHWKQKCDEGLQGQGRRQNDRWQHPDFGSIRHGRLSFSSGDIILDRTSD